MEQVNLFPWKIISHTDFYELNPFEKVSTIIIENNGKYFFLEDEYEKIFDISKMPDYIKKDWVNYNKKDLNLSILNKEIKKLEDDLDKAIYEKSEGFEEKLLFKETIKLLKSLRRDMIINGLI